MRDRDLRYRFTLLKYCAGYRYSWTNQIAVTRLSLFGFFLITLAVVNLGCVARGSTKELSFSRLAGSWSMTLGEFVHAQGADSSSLHELEAYAEDRILVATIRPDGTFDWTLTMIGVGEGFVGLRNEGDRCTSPTDSSVHFEVISNSYTPGLSRITIRRIDVPSGHSYPWMTMELEAKSAEDDRLWFITRYHDCGEEHVFKCLLRRDYEISASRYNKNIRDKVQSRISGAWAGPDSDGETLVRMTIKQDGTFDWTRMVEGMLGGWYQLRYEGNTSAAFMFRNRCRVLASRYTRTSSQIRIRIESVNEPKYVQEITLNASLNLDGTIRFTISVCQNIDGKSEAVHKELILHRAEPGIRHAETLFYFMDFTEQ